MKELLQQKNITSIYHFSQASNLQSILEKGLLPRKDLDAENIKYEWNDNVRYDNCLDASCMSIAFPNYRMFYKLRQENKDVDWVVLEFDAKILCDFECAYCWTNASDSSVTCVGIDERKGEEAFLKLFEDRDGWPSRSKLGISDSYPTNPQAEVLVFGTVDKSYIKRIIFKDFNTLEKYKSIATRYGISAEVDDTYFRYRSDYDCWRECD